MADLASCPNLDDLQRFLVGRLAEADAERIRRHLAGCADCVAALHRLDARDTLVEAMRAQGEAAERSEDAVVAGLVARLNAQAPPASSLGGKPTEPAAPRVQPLLEGPGTIVGNYKLLEEIGAGGFGVVFLAQQQEPMRRKVALKVLKPGMDTRQVIARFEAERQALAIMDHPNIAKVFDAGETASGRPFFVMELVRGQAITEYCDSAKLAPRARLELGISVCQAVQHAHQKGIIHRDLKPSNVLVTMHDTPLPPLAKGGKVGVVKVIDFGIAKATGAQLTDKTLFTGFAQMVGTPSYMSPEQAGASDLDIDTRSDIYALGVLLYELLTGSTPFDKRRLNEAGYDEIRRIIREEEPPTPSTRLSATAELPAIAARRNMEPKKLSGLVRGELDWIVMKCLEKDRNRRYETASALALDLQRYLDDEPVLAGPPSTWYRLQKFGRRHRRMLAGALAFVVLLVSAVAALAVALSAVSHQKQQTQSALDAEAKRRRQYRIALDRQTSYVMKDLLGRQPALTDGHKRYLRQALADYQEFAADVGQTVEARSAVASAHARVGQILDTLGDYHGSETAYRAALAIYQALAAEFPGEPEYRVLLAPLHSNLAIVLRTLGRFKEGEAANREAVRLYRQVADELPDDPEHRHYLAISQRNLATLLTRIGQLEEAEPLHREALAGHRRLVAEFPKVSDYGEHLARGLDQLGNYFDRTDRRADAILAFREALTLNRQLAAERGERPDYRDHLASTLAHLANGLRHTRLDQAVEHYREALKVRQKLVDDFPAVPSYREGFIETCQEFGQLLAKRGQLEEAEAVIKQAVALARQFTIATPEVPGYRAYLARARLTMGEVYYATKRLPEAEAAAQEALVLLEKLAADEPLVADHANNVAGALGNLALFKNSAKDPSAALKLLERAEPYHQAALKANPKHGDYRAFYRNNFYTRTVSHLRLGQHARAAAVAEQMVGAIVDAGFDHYKAAVLFSRCAEAVGKDDQLTDSERAEQATRHADRAMDLLRQAVGHGYRDAAELRKNTSFDPLRQRDDFKRLIADIEGKSIEGKS